MAALRRLEEGAPGEGGGPLPFNAVPTPAKAKAPQSITAQRAHLFSSLPDAAQDSCPPPLRQIGLQSEEAPHPPTGSNIARKGVGFKTLEWGGAAGTAYVSRGTALARLGALAAQLQGARKALASQLPRLPHEDT